MHHICVFTSNIHLCVYALPNVSIHPLCTYTSPMCTCLIFIFVSMHHLCVCASYLSILIYLSSSIYPHLSILIYPSNMHPSQMTSPHCLNISYLHICPPICLHTTHLSTHLISINLSILHLCVCAYTSPMRLYIERSPISLSITYVCMHHVCVCTSVVHLSVYPSYLSTLTYVSLHRISAYVSHPLSVYPSHLCPSISCVSIHLIFTYLSIHHTCHIPYVSIHLISTYTRVYPSHIH